MQGSVLGLIVSVIASLIIAISFYWAVTHEVSTQVTTYTNTTVENRISGFDVMLQATADRWGTVPGAFDSSLIENITVMFYSNETFSPEAVNELKRRHFEGGESKEDLVKEHMRLGSIRTQANNTVTVNRTITPVFTDGSNPDTLTYTPTIKNLPDKEYNADLKLPTINFEALNLWWQMQNMPSFLQAWQVFSQNTNKMVRQSFLNFFYAHGMYAGQFDSEAWVSDVLFGFVGTDLNPKTADQKTAIEQIVNDIRYGMGSERNITIWIAATLGDTEAIELLTNHYFSGVARIDATWLTTLTDPTTSDIASMIGVMNKTLVSEDIVEKVSDITAEFMGAQQWAQANLLNNKKFAINDTDYTDVASAYDIGMNFLLQPEIQSAGCDVPFTTQLAQSLFNQNYAETDEVSFLNPQNYFNFQEAYETNQFTTILGTWSLTEAQAGCIYRYAHQQTSFAHEQAYANMITTGVVSTLSELTTHFPISLTARMMAYTNSKTATATTTNAACISTVTAALTTTTSVVPATICANENFTDVTTIEAWIAPVWYNDYTYFEQQTGMTAAERTAFYNPTIKDSFGELLNAALSTLYTKYECHQTTDAGANAQYTPNNCSADYLAASQWGESMVTLKPPADSDLYFPLPTNKTETLSVVTWGVNGITVAPEYFYYSQFSGNGGSTKGAPSLQAFQVMNMTNEKYTYFGLGNTYNAKCFLYNYLNNAASNDDAILQETMASWGIGSQQDIYNIVDTLDWLVQEHTLGGLTSTYTQKDMVFGWDSTLVKNIPWDAHLVASNQDKYWLSGDAIYYARMVTPFIHKDMWSDAPVNPVITVNTGVVNPDSAGMIELMGAYGKDNSVGYEYPSIPMKTATGTGSTVYLPFRCSSANFTEESVYTWQHGKPNAGSDGSITTLNMMNMQLQNQDYDKSDVVCAAGAGETNCSANANLTANQYTQNGFTKSSQFYPSDNCGTRIFSHGTSRQVTNMDEDSGLSTGYVMQQQNVLRHESLGGATGQAHPFASLKVLYGMLGATNLIPLGNSTTVYKVNPVTFVNVQYPISTAAPTRVISTENTATVTTREATAWVVVIYALLLVFFLVLAGGFIHTIRKDKEGQAAKANHVLYDNLNPAGSPGAEEED